MHASLIAVTTHYLAGLVFQCGTRSPAHHSTDYEVKGADCTVHRYICADEPVVVHEAEAPFVDLLVQRDKKIENHTQRRVIIVLT